MLANSNIQYEMSRWQRGVRRAYDFQLAPTDFRTKRNSSSSAQTALSGRFLRYGRKEHSPDRLQVMARQVRSGIATLKQALKNRWNDGGEDSMDEVSRNKAERDSRNGGGQAIQILDGPRVMVLNRTRHIVVRIDLNNVPPEDLRWEGRGDRLLLFWKNHYFLRRDSSEEFRSDCLSSLYARAVSLPCDVDFSNADLGLSGSSLTLRLPKEIRQLEHEAGQPADSFCQRNEALADGVLADG